MKTYFVFSVILERLKNMLPSIIKIAAFPMQIFTVIYLSLLQIVKFSWFGSSAILTISIWFLLVFNELLNIFLKICNGTINLLFHTIIIVLRCCFQHIMFPWAAQSTVSKRNSKGNAIMVVCIFHKSVTT